MGENSYKQALNDARTDIAEITQAMKDLDAAIISAAGNVRKGLGGFKGTSASDVNKEVKNIEQALASLKNYEKAHAEGIKKRESALKKESELRYKLSKEKEKSQEKEFQQLQKATQIQKKYNAEIRKAAEEEQKVKKAREASLSKEMTARMVENVKNIGRTNDGLRKMASYYAELERSTKKAATAEERIKTAREKSISKQLTGQMKEHVNSIGRTNDELKKMNSYYAQLEKSTAKAAARNNALGNAYDKLVAKQQLHKRLLQEAIVLHGKDSAQALNAAKSYNVLTGKVNQANAAFSKLGTARFGGLIAGVKNLAAAFGLIGGVFLIAQVVRNVFELSKKLDSLSYAMKTVISDARDLNRTQVFLSRIANSYGASIVALTERYIKFVAAAKQSNLSLEKTEKIFEKVTKAAGVLGLKKDELNGVFLALEQMISKGKVTTEELRRQLGERLPGAFGIMANALGVTVAQLDKMLRKGEILSSEALPLMVDEMEKAYGIGMVTRVDTLVAAQERLSNSWIEFVSVLNGEKGGSAIIAVFNGLSKAMENISKRTEQFFMVFDSGFTAMERFKIKMNSLTTITGITNGLFEEQVEVIKEARTQHEIFIETIKQEGQQARIAAKQFMILHGSMAPFKDPSEYVNGEIFSFLDSYNEGERTAEDVAKDLTAMNKALRETPKENTTRISYLKEQILLLQEEAKIWEINAEKKKKAGKETKEVIEGSLDALSKMRSDLEDERDRLATSTEQREEYNIKIKATEDAIYKLIEAQERLQEYKDDYGYDLGQEGTNAGTDFMATLPQGFGQHQADDVEAEKKKEEEKEEIWKLFVKREEAIRLGAFDVAQDINSDILAASKSLSEQELEILSAQLDKEVEMFAAAAETKKALQEGLTDILMETGESLLERRINEVDEEIDNNKRLYAAKLDDENLSEEQRSAIEAERDRKEVELAEKKKKREKENFLIKQGLALAEIGVNLALTLSAINLAAANIAASIPAPAGLVMAALHMATYTPMAITQAAMSAGMVLAQTIPAFETGTDNADRGWAIVDEKRPEVHLDKHGNVKSFGSDKGANLRFLEQGDQIVKSHADFFGSHNEADLQKAVFNMNMSSQGAEISKHQVDNLLRNELKGLKTSNEKVWREVKKLASRPINNNVTVNVPDNSAY